MENYKIGAMFKLTELEKEKGNLIKENLDHGIRKHELWQMVEKKDREILSLKQSINDLNKNIAEYKRKEESEDQEIKVLRESLSYRSEFFDDQVTHMVGLSEGNRRDWENKIIAILRQAKVVVEKWNNGNYDVFDCNCIGKLYNLIYSQPEQPKEVKKCCETCKQFNEVIPLCNECFNNVDYVHWQPKEDNNLNKE
jgi:hypothetical protein